MFITPTTDFAFKKIFGSQQSTDILISFLNATLYNNQENQITDLEIIDPYQAARLKGLKDSCLDIKARLSDHTTVIIEMQVLNVLGFKQRILYNSAKFYANQLEAGENYTLLHPVIALTITDFELFPETPKVISSFLLKEEDEMTVYSNDLKLVFIELPKFQKSLELLESLTDKWIYFLRNANQLRSVPNTMEEDPALQHAFRIAEQSQLTREELEIFEQQARLVHDRRNSLLYAEQQGEKNKAIQIARQLLGVLELETIAQTTGLTVEEVRSLHEQ